MPEVEFIFAADDKFSYFITFSRLPLFFIEGIKEKMTSDAKVTPHNERSNGAK